MNHWTVEAWQVFWRLTSSLETFIVQRRQSWSFLGNLSDDNNVLSSGVAGKINMDVSKNGGFSPQIIHFNRVFHVKPSILGYPYFWKHPYLFLFGGVGGSGFAVHPWLFGLQGWHPTSLSYREAFCQVDIVEKEWFGVVLGDVSTMWFIATV